jgi:nucleoside phosphorylase
VTPQVLSDSSLAVATCALCFSKMMYVRHWPTPPLDPAQRPPMKHTILFLAANPLSADRVALDREARGIQVELERSGFRDRFEFVTRWAAEPLDLLRELRKLKPTVVHFSGHSIAGVTDHAAGPESHRDIDIEPDYSGGDLRSGLFFQGPDGSSRLVSTKALEATFGAAGSSVKLIVLNACYSELNAQALLRHVGCVVGMSGAIADDTARTFAIGFYGGLGERESIASAYEQGRAAISLLDLSDHDSPKLAVRAGIDASELVLAADPVEIPSSQGGTDTAGHSPTSRSRQTPSRQVDIGILTTREDELRAVLQMFSTKAGVVPGAHREYTLRHAEAGDGERYTITVLRQSEQGLGEAQTVARDLIEDLAPRLVLVVGIASGLPSDDIMLGDVVVSTRIHDFTVEARKAGHEFAYATTGGPIDRVLTNAVADLASREDVLGNWTAELPERPQVTWTRKGQLEGPPEWQRELRVKLAHHHGKGATLRAPVYVAGPIASSDRLVKDPAVLIPWLTTARNLLAVEMESGGVYRAVRERCPMLAIRGISDIVGLKCSGAWTKYACASAAAFTAAFLRTRPIELSTAAGSDMESPHARSKREPNQPKHDPYVASPPTGNSRMTTDEMFNLLSKLLPSQFEAVLFRAKVPIEHIPAGTAPQAERAIATIRYFELHGRLDQLAQTVQQIVSEGGHATTDPQ